MNKTANATKKQPVNNNENKSFSNNEQTIGLFDEQQPKKRKNFLSRFINSIGPSTYMDEDITKQAFNQENNNENDEDIYNTPAIKRKAG